MSTPLFTTAPGARSLASNARDAIADADTAIDRQLAEISERIDALSASIESIRFAPDGELDRAERVHQVTTELLWFVPNLPLEQLQREVVILTANTARLEALQAALPLLPAVTTDTEA